MDKSEDLHRHRPWAVASSQGTSRLSIQMCWAPGKGKLSDDVAFLTVEETAQLLRVHKNTIYRWVREGRLPSTRIGKQWRIPREALERLLNGGDV